MQKTKAASPGRTPAPRRSSAQKAASARGIAITRCGDLGEVAFVHKAMSLGYVVAKPYGQMHRYDFMVEGGNKLWTLSTLRPAHHPPPRRRLQKIRTRFRSRLPHARTSLVRPAHQRNRRTQKLPARSPRIPWQEPPGPNLANASHRESSDGKGQ
jgi:hypothetical protein